MKKLKSKYDLFKYFAELGYKIGAEIGVAGGYLSEAMFKSIPNLHLYCIDFWQPYHGNPWSGSSGRNDNNYQEAKKRLTKYNATLIRDMSMNAVKRFENDSLDFVYIDSNHSFDYVMEDLIEWSKKVRSGGIVSGDDYYDFRKAGVIAAVDTYTKAHGIKLNLTDPKSEKIRDREGFEQPSYWWIKE